MFLKIFYKPINKFKCIIIITMHSVFKMAYLCRSNLPINGIKISRKMSLSLSVIIYHFKKLFSSSSPSIILFKDSRAVKKGGGGGTLNFGLDGSRMYVLFFVDALKLEDEIAEMEDNASKMMGSTQGSRKSTYVYTLHTLCHINEHI